LLYVQKEKKKPTRGRGGGGRSWESEEGPGESLMRAKWSERRDGREEGGSAGVRDQGAGKQKNRNVQDVHPSRIQLI